MSTFKRRATIVILILPLLGAHAAYRDYGGRLRFVRWVGW